MSSELNETTPRVENPYRSQPSYKEALLATVSDTTNRMGINTFKLLNLIRKSRKQQDDEQNEVTMNVDNNSEHSEGTPAQQNTSKLQFYRMRFQFTIEETSPDTYLEDVAEHINNILEVINLNTPGVCLTPWHTTEDPKKDELITTMTDDALHAVKYLFGFKAGLNRAGTQYLRIRLAFPSKYSADDIVHKNKNSIMIPGKQTLLKANSQCLNPITIGWFLRSTPTMTDFDDISSVLKVMWNIKGAFGLYWATVKDGKPYDAMTTTRAIHMEAEEEEAAKIISWAEKTYGRASTNTLDYPLGINMMFVRPYNEVQGSAKALVAKLAIYQNTNDKMLISASWFGEMALERSIQKEKFISLRQWLMSLQSIHPKSHSSGATYYDKLFHSIHCSQDNQETKFYFYKANETEATNVIAALPLVVKEELHLDPGCFFHKSDFLSILEGTWSKDKREYKNKGILNQEQYLRELDECFMLNRAFLPEVIVLDNVANSQQQAKAMAMANGEEDISVLSNLTEKTLKAATTPGGSEDASVASGHTSRSKTQAAVRAALKEVSLEHNKAMVEQQQKFQQELAALRKSFERQSTVGQTVQAVATIPSTPTSGEEQVAQSMDEDSSDDEVALQQTQRRSKRPKRSQSKSKQGRGASSTQKRLNE
jgi:hypothetical protein